MLWEVAQGSRVSPPHLADQEVDGNALCVLPKTKNISGVGRAGPSPPTLAPALDVDCDPL